MSLRNRELVAAVEADEGWSRSGAGSKRDARQSWDITPCMPSESHNSSLVLMGDVNGSISVRSRCTVQGAQAWSRKPASGLEVCWESENAYISLGLSG